MFTYCRIQDEDLGLPPPNLHLQSGAASRKASVRESARQTPRPSAVKAGSAAGATTAGSALPKTAAATTAPAQQIPDNGPNRVQLASNSSDSVITTSRGVAVPAVDAAKVTSLPAASTPTKPLAVSVDPPAIAVQANAAAPPPATALPVAADSLPADTIVSPPTSVPDVSSSAEPVALTGSAAILAKLRSQLQTSRPTSATAEKQQDRTAAKVTVLYASQTGTGQEIARTIHAECSAKGIPAEVMSFNELGFDNLTASKTPVVVFVASSTGDGDPPENAAAAYVAMKKSWSTDRLAGIKFTVLGLGDSNYTRFMHVPRAVKNRCVQASPQGIKCSPVLTCYIERHVNPSDPGWLLLQSQPITQCQR